MKRGIFLLFVLLISSIVMAHEHDSECLPEEGCEFSVLNNEEKTFREWLVTGFRPGYEAKTASYWLASILIILVAAFSIVGYKNIEPKKRNVKFWIKPVFWVFIVIVVTFVLYSSYVYWYSGVSTKGIEVCDENGCRLSVHWHATLQEMSVCNEIVERPWEKGDLDEQHTHKDNRMHFHSILYLDKDGKEIVNKERLSLGKFFDQIEWRFDENCFKDKCDCNGKKARTRVWVNNEEINNIRDYIWKDGDLIIIKYE